MVFNEHLVFSFRPDIIDFLEKCQQLPVPTISDYANVLQTNLQQSDELEEKKEAVGLISECTYLIHGHSKVT